MIVCTGCRVSLQSAFLNRPNLSDCPGCGVPLLVEIFPALFRNPSGARVGDAVLVEQESSCFYHAQKKAVTLCEACGRFLCALCDLEFAGQHLCPQCLESGRRKGKVKNLENHRTLYDSIALWLALFPLLLYPFVVLTAPIAVFIAIRYWHKPSSILPRTHIRKILAIFFGSIEILLIGVVVYFLLSSR